MTKDKKKNVEEAVTKAISDLNTVNGYKNSGVVPYAVLILALLENIVERRLGVEHLDAFLNIDRGLPLKGQPINLNRADMMLLLDDVFQDSNVTRELSEAITYLSTTKDIDPDNPISIDLVSYDGEKLFNAIIKAMRLEDNLFASSSISELAASILNVQDGESFCDFTSGIGLSTACITRGKDDVDIDLVEMSIFNATLSVCLGFLCSKKNFHVEIGDGFARTEKKYDKLFIDPPLKTRTDVPAEWYGIKTDDAVLLSVLKATEVLSEKGRAIVMVPGSFLFGAMGAFPKVREYLVREGLVKGVVLLPSMWKATTIKTAMIVLEKNLGDVAMISIASDKDVKIFTTYDKLDRSKHLTKDAIGYITDRLNNDFEADNNSCLVSRSTLEYHYYPFEPSFFIKQVPKSNRTLSEIDADIESSINEIDTLIEELKIKK